MPPRPFADKIALMFTTTLLWIAIAFLSGSLPWSVWLGKVALGVDIRDYGDGNPGAANVWAAGGAGWGMLAILLDGFKGLIPVAVANFIVGIDGWQLALVALAPVLGHAFSPFLGFNGGKALAVTFGVWTGMTGTWVVPVLLGLFFALGLWLLKPEGWAILAGSLALLAALLLLGAPDFWYILWVGATAVLLFKQRADLGERPTVRSFKKET